MASFPTLTPSSRSFTPGRHPHSEIGTLNGLQTRVRTSNVILEQRLRLTFVALTETQMLSVRTHYNTQQGQFIPFDLPSSLLSGMSAPANFTPTGYSWIYAASPEVEDIGLQRYTVNVELLTVPYEGANINGAEFNVAISMTTGLGTGLPLVAGTDLTVSTSIQGGLATGELLLNIPASNITVAAAAPVYVGETVAPTYVGSSAYVTTGTKTTTTPWPSGHQAGDLAVWFGMANAEGGIAGVTLSGTGWTSFFNQRNPAFNQYRIVMFYKYATSSAEAATVASYTGQDYGLCSQIIVFRNTAVSSPIDASAIAYAYPQPNPVSNPVNVTTTGPKRFIWTFMNHQQGTISGNSVAIASVGAGYTNVFEVESNAYGWLGTTGGTQDTTGLSPQITLTWNDTRYQFNWNIQATIAIKPT